jgi:formamidopyrimidine-DNA glycosylase
VPELAEVEAYRRLAAEGALGRTIEGVEAPDSWYLKDGATASQLESVLVGRHLVQADRRGKLLLLPTSGAGDECGPVLGLRFGMSGRLLVDGTAGVDDLWYSSNRPETRWDRFALRFDGGGRLVMRDPRRLGGVFLDPDVDRLGPDGLTVTVGQLRQALLGRRAGRSAGHVAAEEGVGGGGPALKARLLDQSRVAGVGNLAADEMLWRARLDPGRPASSLTDTELRRLHRHLRATLAGFVQQGGSHTGDLMPERRPGGVCPKDGTPLLRATIGTRTTYWCPRHQR